MRILASDLIGYYRPSECGLRIYLRQTDQPEAAPSEFEQILQRLGRRHEQQHLRSFHTYTDLSEISPEERFERTKQAMASCDPVIYQGALRSSSTLVGIDVTVVGYPDFLVFDSGGYIIRDAKLSLRINEDDHPEILYQLQVYGWLYEQTTGSQPKGLQVYSGRGELVDIPFNATTAIAELGRIVSLKTVASEPYEPVGWTKCGGCGYHDRCWKVAENNSDISLLPDVDQSLARTLHAAGVRTIPNLLSHFDVAGLSELKRPQGSRSVKVGNRAERILRTAHLMQRHQETVLAIPAIPSVPNYTMFDLEGMPPHLNELDKIYLWGLQIYGQQPSRYLAATANIGAVGDKEGWDVFLQSAKEIFARYGDIPFVHWAAYEKTYVSKYIKRYGDPDGIAQRVLVNLIDLLPITREAILLPLPSFSLKVIEQYVGFQRTQTEYGGDWAMATFIEATETEDSAKRNSLINEIIRYNEEDLQAMWVVFEWLRSKRPGVQAAQP